MKRIDCGLSGNAVSAAETDWSELRLEAPWLEVVRHLSGSDSAREVQRIAIESGAVLDGRKNLIISAPTNGGKSLVGELVLFDAIREGGRVVLIEPLRALAQEKFDRYQELKPKLESLIGRSLEIGISTGDYRLENEQFSSPPDDEAQLIITTPERLDAIARHPDHLGWIETIRAACFDEAHLLSSKRRGPVIEYLITFLNSLAAPPRIVLLSASLSDTDDAEKWLHPCQSIVTTLRSPPLQKYVIALTDGEDADTTICDQIANDLAASGKSFLVFVYQTKSANSLAKRISTATKTPDFALAYHSQMSASQRATVRNAYIAGSIRCVVATTALSMGVNLPATDVYIRDIVFPGVGRLSIPEILQMAGRAGRGNTPGVANVIRRHDDFAPVDELVDQLKAEPLQPLRSSFAMRSTRRGVATEIEPGLLEIVTTHLSRFPDGQTADQLRSFFQHSLGGDGLGNHIDGAISWLSDPSRTLVARNDAGAFVATSLATHAVRSTLPLDIAAGVGQLLRDLLELDPDDKYLRSWSPLDHLILLGLLSDRQPSLRRFSKQLVGQVTDWIEAYRGEKPVLFREWIHGDKNSSKAAELLGSLGIECETEEKARQLGYLATFRAIVLTDRGQGLRTDDLERRWSIENLSGVEEQWRDTMIWLLNATTKILETRCYFFHLKQNCEANSMRIKRVETCFRAMRRQLFGLQDHLKYCSPLGGVLRSMKRTTKKSRSGVGVQSIRKLELAGIGSLADLAKFSRTELKTLGLREPAINQITSYLRRRSL